MAVVGDIRPLLYAARFFGFAPHVVTEDDMLVTRSGTIYTIIWTIVYLLACFFGMYTIVATRDMDSKALFLTAIRTLFYYVCLFTDTTLTIVWNCQIRSAIAQLRSFDRATRFAECRGSNRMQNVSWIVVGVLLTFWTSVGYATYSCEKTAKLFNGLSYGIVNAAMSFQVMKFIALALLLRQRFRRLCDILLITDAGKLMVLDHGRIPIRLQEIWWLHCCLANATETINSVYAVQLLLWIITMSFNTLSRLYTINNVAIPTLLQVRESLLVTACVANLLILTIVCHSTAAQANRVAKIVFSPMSPVVGKRDFMQLSSAYKIYGAHSIVDNVEAAAYFQLRKVHFFAAGGIIRIDLPLLLSIASGITTYLVILHAGNNG